MRLSYQASINFISFSAAIDETRIVNDDDYIYYGIYAQCAEAVNRINPLKWRSSLRFEFHRNQAGPRLRIETRRFELRNFIQLGIQGSVELSLINPFVCSRFQHPFALYTFLLPQAVARVPRRMESPRAR